MYEQKAGAKYYGSGLGRFLGVILLLDNFYTYLLAINAENRSSNGIDQKGLQFVHHMDAKIYFSGSRNATLKDSNLLNPTTVSYTHLTLPTKRIV